jgi:hypothetical protein
MAKKEGESRIEWVSCLAVFLGMFPLPELKPSTTMSDMEFSVRVPPSTSVKEKGHPYRKEH